MEKKEDYEKLYDMLFAMSRRFIRRTRNVSASDCGVLSLFH